MQTAFLLAFRPGVTPPSPCVISVVRDAPYQSWRSKSTGKTLPSPLQSLVRDTEAAAVKARLDSLTNATKGKGGTWDILKCASKNHRRLRRQRLAVESFKLPDPVLAPCPFTGKPVKIEGSGGFFRIRFNDGKNCMEHTDKDTLVKQWNQRVRA